MRTQGEIDEQRDIASNETNQGSKFPGMSYEEGVIAALDWVTEQTDIKPMEDE